MSPLYRYRKPNSLIIHFIHHVYYIDIITIIIASSKHHHRIISIIIIIVIIIIIIIIIILPNLFYRLSINAMSLGPLFFFQLLPPAATRADAVTSQIRQGLEVLYSSDRYSAWGVLEICQYWYASDGQKKEDLCKRREREREIQIERERDRERERERVKEREKERERDTDRERERVKERERQRDQYEREG